MTTSPPPSDLYPLLASTNGKVLETPARVGEVIESSTEEFVAQACELDAAPPFGSWVHVAPDNGQQVFGIVAHVQTAGLDPGARPIMRGYEDVRDDRIYAENPDLPLVLRTTFRVLAVGYTSGGRARQVLPPRPPRLHYSVHLATAGEVKRIVDEGLDYLGTVLNAADVPSDELLAANVRLTEELLGAGDGTFARFAGRELAQLLRGDYARLTSVLRRMVPPR